jgi:hypothetical protein
VMENIAASETKFLDKTVNSLDLGCLTHIGAYLPGAVGADAPIDHRSLGTVHPWETWNPRSGSPSALRS